MNLDWRRLKAVIIESDDWGLCAWSPDEQAHRVLSDTPAYRTPVGRRFGGSTLESAADVRTLVETLMEFRGGDGFPLVWQANTVVAAPDYSALRPPSFDVGPLPLIDLPETPSRWARPGLWEAVRQARETGVWWPELHGLHHLPETAWLRALRRGTADARRAHEHQSPICVDVESSGEYDPSEPEEVRRRNLQLAVEKFATLFGRPPGSFCPPDYRWGESLEPDAHRLGLHTLQGWGERVGSRFPKLRRLVWRYRWPYQGGSRFRMPLRIGFEPSRAERTPVSAVVGAVHRAVREAWARGQPAVVSTHRVNFAHLDPERAAAGRAALRDLLERLVDDGAVFLVDVEVQQLHQRGWSLRPIGEHGALLRFYGVPREPLRFPARPGSDRVSVREGRGTEAGELSVTNGEVVARLNVGEYLLEWKIP